MGNVAKLAIAGVLAGLAGLGNFIWLLSRDQPSLYVGINSDYKESIEAGTPLIEDDFEPVASPGDVSQTFVPWEERALLIGRTLARDYAPGDLILHQDLVSTLPRWEVLGPFELISVGDRIRNQSGDYTDGRGSNSVTVAVQFNKERKRFDQNTERLLDIIDGSAGGAGSGNARIVALQLYPPDDADEYEDDTESGLGEDFGGLGDSTESGLGEDFGGLGDSTESGLGDDFGGLGDSTESGLGDDFGGRGDGNADGSNGSSGDEVRWIIVPLSGVESIPEVLVKGDQIGFVVPAQ